jgi:glycosyltransferase 2 family protein
VRSGRATRLVLGFLLAGVLLFLFFRGLDLRALAAAFRSADPLGLLAVSAITVVTYVARAWRWGDLLAPLGRIPFGRLFSATLVGFTTGLFVPRAGEVVRPYLVARHHSLSVSAAFASIIVERLVDLITVLGLFSLYLYVLPAPAAQLQGGLMLELKRAGALTAGLALVVLAVLLAFHSRAEGALAVAERLLVRLPQRLAQPLREGLRAFSAGLGVLQAPWPHLVKIAGQSLLTWLSIALAIFVNNRAFGIALPFHASFLMLGFLTVGVAVPTPGMVGGFHYAYQLALTKAFAVDKESAAAAGIACHALTNLPVLLLGLFFLAREGLSVGRVADLAERGREDASGAGAGSEPGLGLDETGGRGVPRVKP